MVEIPPRLSDKQRFILVAAYRTEQRQAESRAESDWRRDRDIEEPEDALPVPVRYAVLSQSVADEFGGRKSDHIAPREERIRSLQEDMGEKMDAVLDRDDLGDEEKADRVSDIRSNSRILMMMASSGDADQLTRSHRSAMSTAVKRLEERGLIERQHERKRRYLNEPTDYTHAVTLSKDGRAVARELDRRARDGRYSFAVETLKV